MRIYILLGFITAICMYILVPKNILIVHDQAKGTTVRIARATLSRDGYIVITRRTATGEEEKVGVSDLLPSGTYSNKDIVIDHEAMDTSSKELLHIRLAVDGGDRSYGAEDQFVRTVTGRTYTKRMFVY